MTLSELSEAYLEHIEHLEMRILQLKRRIDDAEDEYFRSDLEERIKYLENMCEDEKKIQSLIEKMK